MGRKLSYWINQIFFSSEYYMQPRLPEGDLLIITVELGQGQIDSLAV